MTHTERTGSVKEHEADAYECLICNTQFFHLQEQTPKCPDCGNTDMEFIAVVIEDEEAPGRSGAAFHIE